MAKKQKKPAARKQAAAPKDVLDALIKTVNKDLSGQVRIRRACDYETAFHIRRPTGITGIDAALRGGWPAGALSQIHGPEGQGKDYLLNCTIRMVQERYGKESRVFIASFGNPTHDLAFAETCGVDLDLGDLHVVSYDTPHREDASAKPAENILEACLRLLRSGQYQLGILNEVGAEVTSERARKDLDEPPSPGDTARLMTEYAKKFSHCISQPIRDGRHEHPNTTTMLLVTQVRESMSLYGQKYTMPGGHALRHLKAVDLHLRSAGPLKHDDDLVGRRIHWTIRKGKLGIHDGPEGHFDYYFESGVNLCADLVDTALSSKAVVLVPDPEGTTRPGQAVAKVLHAPDLENGGYWRTRTDLEEALENSGSLYRQLRMDVLRKAQAYDQSNPEESQS